MSKKKTLPKQRNDFNLPSGLSANLKKIFTQDDKLLKRLTQ